MSPQTRAALGLARTGPGPAPVIPGRAAIGPTGPPLAPTGPPLGPPTGGPTPPTGPPLAPTALADGVTALADGVTALAVVLRVQRRLAIRTMLVLLSALILGPAVLAAYPALSGLRVAGIPLVWLLLGGAAYPLLLLLAARHRRAVDAVEGALARREAREPD